MVGVHTHTHTHTHVGGALCVMVIVIGNRHDETSSSLDEANSISHCTITLGKGMNPIILPPDMSK